MAFKLKVHGIEVIASTVEEAAALIREFAKPSDGPEPQDVDIEDPLSPNDLLLAPPHISSFDAVEVGLRFLEMIQSAPHTGASSDQINVALRTNHPKGVGSRLALINHLLLRQGFRDPDGEVYRTRRTHNGRVWIAGPGLIQAIENFKSVLRGSGVPR